MPTATEPEANVCFVGMGSSAVGWYRCYLPAMALGCDWVGVIGEPPLMRLETGLVGGETRFPDLTSYEIVVIQQPRGNGWLRIIRELQARGVKVLYEIDDYLHAIHKVEGHDGRNEGWFNADELKRLELTMRVCDGVICSTEYIAKRYRKFNPNTFVCENGIDAARYALTRPARDKVNIGWAGGTGHDGAMRGWILAVANTMLHDDNACFVTIGHDYASSLMEHFPGRCMGIPFTLIDTYPAAMTMFDVNLAPVYRASGGQVHQFFRGKSDLRWVEAGALGIPTIGDPAVYPNIEDGVTGFHAVTQDEVEEKLELLLSDPKLRIEVGSNAQQYVKENRTVNSTSRQWERVFSAMSAGSSATSR